MKAPSISIAILFMLLFASHNTYAVLINSEPPSNYIVTTGNGLEWVYASPASPIYSNPAYAPQELYGFKVATAVDFSGSFLSLADLIQQFAIPNATFSVATCASPYFTDLNQCNGTDVHAGYVWQNPWNVANSTNTVAESFMVRGSSVPEPATIALIGLGLAGLGFSRKRKA